MQVNPLTPWIKQREGKEILVDTATEHLNLDIYASMNAKAMAITMAHGLRGFYHGKRWLDCLVGVCCVGDAQTFSFETHQTGFTPTHFFNLLT